MLYFGLANIRLSGRLAHKDLFFSALPFDLGNEMFSIFRILQPARASHSHRVPEFSDA